MAFERETERKVNTKQTAPAGENQDAGDDRSSARTGSRDMRWANLGGRIAPGVPTRRIGANLTAYAEAAQSIFMAASGGYEYKTLLLDVAENPRLNVSSVVVVGRPADSKEAGVGFHILLLEGSIDEIAPIQRSEQGENFKVQRVVGDAYTTVLVDAVKDKISTQFNVVGSKIYDGRASVIPADMKADDEIRMPAMIIKAMQAAAMAVEVKTSDFQDLSLADLDRNQQINTAVILSGERPITNAEGFPLRADFRIAVSAVDKSMSQEDSFAFSAEANIATTSGYVDLIFNPTTENNKDYLYQPVFIINSLDCPSLQTTATALLTVSNATVVAVDHVWTRQFNPRTQHHRHGGLNDIGALGFDLGNHQKIDTRFEEFTQQNFNDLMKAVVVPELAFCMDTPETDSSSSWTSVFGFAAAGDKDAVQHLLDSAQRLTNGHFERIYADKGGRGQNGGVMIDLGIRVVQGHYTDSEGVKRDIADYDNLAVMNLFGDKDQTIFREFSDTFLDKNGSQDFRMAKRIRILERIQAFKLTGFATRNMFEPAFLEALTAACGAAGFKPNLRLPHTDPGMQQRATGDRFSMGRTSAGGAFGFGNRGSSGGYESTRSGFSRFLGR